MNPPDGGRKERYCWVTGLKPEKADDYRALHADPWPSVTAQIRACHIQNFSIHEIQIHGDLYLIAYFEYTGSDLAQDLQRMADDPETQRWWRETDPCQSPLPQAAAVQKVWAEANEVFYLE